MTSARNEGCFDEFTVRVHSPIRSMHGHSEVYYYEKAGTGESCYAAVIGEVTGRQDVLVRIQSECTVGQVFGSRGCDCRQQLDRSLEALHADRKAGGVLIYLFQEGMGHGHLAKARAMKLVADEGIDMVVAYESLGFPTDERRYDIVVAVLRDLGVKPPIRLLTNSPDKIRQLEALGIEVKRVPLQIEPDPHNIKCLSYKKRKLGQLLDLPDPHPSTAVPT